MSPPSAVRVRDATTTDLGALTALHASTFALDEDRARTDLREELARPWARVLVAVDEATADRSEAIVGYAVFWYVADEGNLLHVAVAPHALRGGIGSRLVERGIAIARERNATQMILEVRASNAPAIGLYRRLGFEAVTTRTGYYEDGEDACVMAFRIAPP